MGETAQYLNKRMYLHKYNIKSNDNSALVKHALDTPQNINFDNAKITHKEKHRYTLIRTLYIENKMKNTLNKNETNLQNNIKFYSLCL